MSLTQHLGYGRYHLEDFLPGELFARFDGSLALVCDPDQIFGNLEAVKRFEDPQVSDAGLIAGSARHAAYRRSSCRPARPSVA